MSYSNLIFDNNDSSNLSLNAMANSTRLVEVRYNNTSLHTIAGPTPIIDISNSVSNDANDLPEYIRTTVQIQGKIVRNSLAVDNVGLTPPTPGFSGVVGAINEFKKLFSSCAYSNLEVTCDNNVLYSLSGVAVRDINFKQTGDNWTKTADYDITLEAVLPISGAYENDPPVTNKTNRWSIEQIDDTFYTNIDIDISHQRPEYSNPVLGATPGQNIPPTTIQNTQARSSIQVVNLPQFRITHSVSAKGLPPTTGANCNLSEMNEICLQNAKKWVEKQLRQSANSQPSGIMPYIPLPNSGTFFFNHIRSVNIDLSTYDVSDSWLAMPTGIPYTETYTLESSIDENMIKTVRVVGNIVGLHPIVTGLIYDGLELDTSSGIATNKMLSSSQLTTNRYEILDSDALQSANPPNPVSPLSRTSRNTTIAVNKYNNALSGWLYDIKPHLYRRACIVMNTPDKTLNYTNPARTSDPPANHIYAKDRPLSTIPSSMNEGHDPRKGTINYSAEYKNNLKVISGVISENIDINYDVPRDEVATIAVPGRALGPILSRTGRSASRKTLNISVVVLPPANASETPLTNPNCPMYTGGHVYQTIQEIILGNKPFIGSPLFPAINPNGIVFTQSDNESWSPTQGRYSRNVQWIYQACDVSKNYLDH